MSEDEDQAMKMLDERELARSEKFLEKCVQGGFGAAFKPPTREQAKASLAMAFVHTILRSTEEPMACEAVELRERAKAIVFFAKALVDECETQGLDAGGFLSIGGPIA
jgi:hypothetical protein